MNFLDMREKVYLVVVRNAFGRALYYMNTYIHKHFMPIGRSHIITDCEAHTIKTIDNMSAKEFYLKYLGCLSDEHIKEIGHIFPLLIHEGDSYIMIPVISITQDGHIVTNTEVLKGSLISLGYVSHDHTADERQKTLLSLVENTSKELNVLNQTLENLVTQKTNELLEHYYLDPLTKLPNQNKLTEVLNQEEIRSVALIDISSFININNFYGNYIGNKLLRELANLITDFCTPVGYHTFRIHADIFAIITSDPDDPLFDIRLKQLQALIGTHCFMEESLEIYITTVMAISHYTHHIYEVASMTLEYAKGQKLSCLIYDQTLKIEESIKNNLIWTAKIRTAIENDKIIPYFQPIFNNTTKKVDRFEVLMRLIDEDNNVVTPYYFLEIAKKAKLYTQLTRIIIDKAFEHFHDSRYKFSINLSSEDIVDKEMRRFIYEKLAKYPKSHQLTFEIVESEGINNYDEVKEFIDTIKQHGVQIAIDDFGTGFSNFHYLFRLNVDVIKIDGSIIQQIKGERAASLVAETIVDFARKMGIATVAEFVSDEDIFIKTNELGIDYSQGFYVSKPKAHTKEPEQ